MNVLLITSPPLSSLSANRDVLPITLIHLAAVLREAGHAPDILDVSVAQIPDGVTPEAQHLALALEKIRATSPGFICINCFSTMSFPQVRKLAQGIKAFVPEIPICIGGAHPSIVYREIMEHCPEIDFIAIGEGELQTVALANAIAAGTPEALQDIPAFAYRRPADGAVMVNARKGYIDDLSILPLPAYDLLHLPDYYSDHSTWYNPKGLPFQLAVPVFSSRSCPFSCNFCTVHSVSGRKLRLRKPETVVRELEILVREHGQTYFAFHDENSILNNDHFIAICEGVVKKGLDIQMSLGSGVYLNAVDEPLLKAFAKAGGVALGVPIESGNEHIRNTVVGKNLKDETIRRVVPLLKKYNLFTVGFFIMGFEEETAASLDDSIALMEELRLDVNSMSVLVPLPGTRCFESARKNKNLLIQGDDMWSGNVFFDKHGGSVFFIKPPGISLEALEEYRQRFRGMYLFSERAKALNRQSA